MVACLVFPETINYVPEWSRHFTISPAVHELAASSPVFGVCAVSVSRYNCCMVMSCGFDLRFTSG